MNARSRLQWLIAPLLLAGGVALGGLAALPFTSVQGWVDQFAGDGSAEPYTPALHRRLQIAVGAGCLVCFALARASFLNRSADDMAL